MVECGAEVCGVRKFFDAFYRFRVAVGFGAAVLLAGGAGIEVYAVRGARVPDWYMHLAMWGLLGIYLYFALKSWFLSRKVRTVMLMTLTEVLSIFWMVILAGKISPETILVANRVAEREALPILYLPMGMLGLLVLVCMAGTVSALVSLRPLR